MKDHHHTNVLLVGLVYVEEHVVPRACDGGVSGCECAPHRHAVRCRKGRVVERATCSFNKGCRPIGVVSQPCKPLLRQQAAAVDRECSQVSAALPPANVRSHQYCARLSAEIGRGSFLLDSRWHLPVPPPHTAGGAPHQCPIEESKKEVVELSSRTSSTCPLASASWNSLRKAGHRCLLS